MSRQKELPEVKTVFYHDKRVNSPGKNNNQECIYTSKKTSKYIFLKRAKLKDNSTIIKQ